MCSSLVPGGVSMSRKSVLGGQRQSERNCLIMAVFLGPRQITADDREGRRKARERAKRDPRVRDDVRSVDDSSGPVVWPFVVAEWVCDLELSSAGCTSTGSHPPGACVTFLSSRPSSLGRLGPVRSMSRMPTLWPCAVRAKASCSVTEDLPTPPLPDNTRRT